jgi:hypothetical protein
MIAAPKLGSLWKLPCRESSARLTRFPWGEAGVSGEEVGKCTRRAWRGKDPSTYARIAGIMSGRATPQQGLATTCKDLDTNGRCPEVWGGGWSGGWVRSSDDGGVTPTEVDDQSTPRAGNARLGRRDPGHSVVSLRVQAYQTQRWDRRDAAARRDGGQTAGARGVCEPTLEPRFMRAGPPPERWRAEPRPEPDSGKPTVRDRRGACGNVSGGAEVGVRDVRAAALSRLPHAGICVGGTG